MKVTTIKHTDVRGKEQKYIKFDDERGEVYLINVGEKTYTEITNILKEKEVVNEKDTKGGNKLEK